MRVMYVHLTVLPYATALLLSTLFLLIHCHSISSLLMISVQRSKDRKLCLLLPSQLGLTKLFLPKTLSLSLFLGLCLQGQRPVLLQWDQRGEGNTKTLILLLFSLELILELTLFFH